MYLMTQHGTVLGRDAAGDLVQLPSDRSLEQAVHFDPADPSRALPGFEMLVVGDLRAFVRAGNALCALNDGHSIAYDRVAIGDWEKFLPIAPERVGSFISYPWLPESRDPSRADVSFSNLAICAIMKNEALNILEWIAYHRVIGVERFFLYDNNSSDNTKNVLEPLIADGTVVYKEWSAVPGQMLAYSDFGRRYRDRVRWAAFIDLDEYINVLGDRPLLEWLDEFGEVGGVALQWLMFGPSGFDRRPTDLQIASYVYRLPLEAGENRHVKTIVRMASFDEAWDPHCFHTHRPVVNELGVALTGRYSIQQVIKHDFVCVNHYFTRSREDWIKKLQRGRADVIVPSEERPDGWFDHYAAAAYVEDRSIERFVEDTRNELRRIEAMAGYQP